MEVNHLDGSFYPRSASVPNPAQKPPAREPQSAPESRVPQPAQSLPRHQVSYTHSVEQIRELAPVNVHPKNHAAIDTILNIAYYDGGEPIINTFA